MMERFVDISPLLDGVKSQIDFAFEFEIPAEEAWDSTEFTRPVAVEGKVCDFGGYIKLEYKGACEYSAKCARCLLPVKGSIEFKGERDVAVPGTLQNEDNDDYIFTDEGRLEICTPVMEQLMLDFPSKVLCRPDCKGLCSRCGADLNEGECKCPKKEIDPRLAILAKIRDELDD